MSASARTEAEGQPTEEAAKSLKAEAGKLERQGKEGRHGGKDPVGDAEPAAEKLPDTGRKRPNPQGDSGEPFAAAFGQEQPQTDPQTPGTKHPHVATLWGFPHAGCKKRKAGLRPRVPRHIRRNATVLLFAGRPPLGVSKPLERLTIEKPLAIRPRTRAPLVNAISCTNLMFGIEFV